MNNPPLRKSEQIKKGIMINKINYIRNNLIKMLDSLIFQGYRYLTIREDRLDVPKIVQFTMD